MQNFLTVGQQVLILFLLILAGYVLGKRKLLGETGAKALSDIALFLATPCVIALSFERECTPQVLQNLGLALGVSLLLHMAGIGLARLLFRKNTPSARVLRAGAVLSNAGFMGLPLQQAVLGDLGVFYGAGYVAVFNITLWSYGAITMGGSANRPSLRKVLVNPGTVGLAAGLLILLCGISVPPLIRTPMSHLAALNTPLPMLFAGYYLSQVDLRKMLTRPVYYAAAAVRLLLVPAVGVGLLYLFGVRGELLVSMSISASAPVAVAVSMFASRYQQDTETAVNMVALSTLLSVITMPTLVALVQTIA